MDVARLEEQRADRRRGCRYTQLVDEPYGTLQAWDPVTQKRVWEVRWPVWNPGTLTTAGDLVFQGRADGDFVAYDARTGEELWRTQLGLGIAAPPITYSIKGRQYVALLVGWGSAAATSAESADARLGVQGADAAARGVLTRRHDDAAATTATARGGATRCAVLRGRRAKANVGKDVYGQCSFCHGANAISGGVAPDLRASPVVLTKEAFADVLRSGSRRRSACRRTRT